MICIYSSVQAATTSTQYHNHISLSHNGSSGVQGLVCSFPLTCIGKVFSGSIIQPRQGCKVSWFGIYLVWLARKIGTDTTIMTTEYLLIKGK